MRAQCRARLQTWACKMQHAGVSTAPQSRVWAWRRQRRRVAARMPRKAPRHCRTPCPSCVQAMRPPPATWPATAAVPPHLQQGFPAAAAAACRALRHAARAASSASSSGGYGPNSTDSDSGYLDVCVSSSQGWLLESASDMWDTSLTSDITSGHASGAYDAIMMLGGGLLPGGGLPEWVVRRLEGCLHLYREQAAATARGLQDDAASVLAGAAVAGAAAEQEIEQEQLRRQAQPWAPERPSGACPIVLLGAGTPHKPPVIDEVGAGLQAGCAEVCRLGVHSGSARRARGQALVHPCACFEPVLLSPPSCALWTPASMLSLRHTPSPSSGRVCAAREHSVRSVPHAPWRARWGPVEGVPGQQCLQFSLDDAAGSTTACNMHRLNGWHGGGSHRSSSCCLPLLCTASLPRLSPQSCNTLGTQLAAAAAPTAARIHSATLPPFPACPRTRMTLHHLQQPQLQQLALATQVPSFQLVSPPVPAVVRHRGQHSLQRKQRSSSNSCCMPLKHTFSSAIAVVRHRGQRLLLALPARPARQLEVRTCGAWVACFLAALSGCLFALADRAALPANWRCASGSSRSLASMPVRAWQASALLARLSQM